METQEPSFWDSIGDFIEGAWETVSPVAQDALGAWTNAQVNQNQTSQGNQSQGNGTTTQQPAQPANTGLVLDTKTALIGGGALLVLVLLLRR
ncbi:hypothetical protein [Bowmanella denitrificans]|uniref:hypothetical protein n=1 Tax=Bowmanella denitrificans TaxID=366582 RepID=UPI000C9C4DE0|nr:hypothetical protein [Bowmanella denitrificans]